MPVITIARQYGAGGSSVASMLAQRLGADLIDKGLIAEVARRAGFGSSEVSAVDEYPTSLIERMATTFSSFGLGYAMAWPTPYSDPGEDSRPVVLRLTQKVIWEAARSGNAVIVGRGAAALLREQPGAVHVFLYAPEQTRAATMMARESISEETARRQMREIDHSRAAYLREIYQVDWRDPQQYTLQLNTGALGYDHTTEIILTAAAKG